MASSSLKYISKLVGKRVLVLGGTSGIGFTVAEAALEHGAHVTVSSSNPARVAAAVERLKGNGDQPALLPRGTVTGHVCDLSQVDRLDENLNALLKVAAGEAGKINHVVFTAGDIPPLAPVTGFTVENIQKAGHVRFLGTMMLAKTLVSYVDLDPSNSFTITGGAGSQKPMMAGLSQAIGYAGALESVTRAFAIELKPLRVNLIAPGSVRTELVEKMLGDNAEASVQQFGAKTLVGKAGSPEDVAEAYMYVMKDKFVTAQVITTDGGYTLV